jgi:hypothetical protein
VAHTVIPIPWQVSQHGRFAVSMAGVRATAEIMPSSKQHRGQSYAVLCGSLPQQGKTFKMGAVRVMNKHSCCLHVAANPTVHACMRWATFEMGCGQRGAGGPLQSAQAQAVRIPAECLIHVKLFGSIVLTYLHRYTQVTVGHGGSDLCLKTQKPL